MPASPFPIRGLVEGFYGAYYTLPQRKDLIRFLGRSGYTHYLYAPKNDRQHRTRWWEPYPPELMARFAQTIAVARRAGLRFCYALAPISYEGAGDFARVAAKLQAFLDIGVRDFSILVDDLAPPLDPDAPGADDAARADFSPYAAAHAEVCNAALAFLKQRDGACTLSMCPTDYHGGPPFSKYLRLLGSALHPEIDVFYTGGDVCAPTITRQDAEAFGEALGRAPLIWDNYPVNDLAMRQELHMGPVRGRDAALHAAVRGVYVNPMIEPEASKVALLSYADYLRDPEGYEPEASWERALRAVGGPGGYAALRAFSLHALDSCLGLAAPSQLGWLTSATLADLRRGLTTQQSPAAQSLRAYLDSLDESCYALKSRLASPALRQDLLPWIEALEDWLWLGRRALDLLRDADDARARRLLDESLANVRAHNRKIGGAALLPLAEYAIHHITPEVPVP